MTTITIENDVKQEVINAVKAILRGFKVPFKVENAPKDKYADYPTKEITPKLAKTIEKAMKEHREGKTTKHTSNEEMFKELGIEL